MNIFVPSSGPPHHQQRQSLLVSLMLLDLLPKLRVLLDTNLLRLFIHKFIQTTQINILGQQRNDVFVESLPVRVFEVVFLALFDWEKALEHLMEREREKQRVKDEVCLFFLFFFFFLSRVEDEKGQMKETRYWAFGYLGEKVKRSTYALMGISLDNGESAGVLGILHDEPISTPISFLTLSSLVPLKNVGKGMRKQKRRTAYQPRHSLSLV